MTDSTLGNVLYRFGSVGLGSKAAHTIPHFFYSALVKAADSAVTVPPHDMDDIISRAKTMKGRLAKRSQVKRH